MRREPRRGPSKLAGLAWITAVLTYVTGMFSASFYLTGYLYRVTGLNPPLLVAQIVNSLLGLVLTGLTINAGTTLARTKGWMPQRNAFAPIIEALERIAKGDFSIRVPDELRDNQIVGQLASSVNKMALELDQMETMRQEFISNVSHEIQSPLTSIRGFAQALQNDRLSPEERRHYLAIIETESTRLSRITENLLKLAALESEHARFEPGPYRLDKQIRGLILACEPQWADKGIEMEVSLEEITVIADEDLLSQVWTNLLHNSIKFTSPGGRICVDLRRQGNSVECSIADTGIGISEEDQAHVFERFYKADRARERAANSGSGLGLSIAWKIVEMHKGTIGLESQPGAGTTFTVCLPAEP